jgi:hypothetical protein
VHFSQEGLRGRMGRYEESYRYYRVTYFHFVIVAVTVRQPSSSKMMGKNNGGKKSTRQFGGKKSAIEIESSIWREEIGNRNRFSRAKHKMVRYAVLCLQMARQL